MKGCRSHVLRGGIPRIVHVIAKNLAQNINDGKNLTVIGVRRADTPEKVTMYRHAHLLGPSQLNHTPDDPLPGTEGRAICVLRTTAPIRVFRDKKRRRHHRKAA